MNRFLLAENPIHPEQSGVWVIHLFNPKAIIQCIYGHVITSQPHAHFTFINSNGDLEEWTLSAHHFFTNDFLTEPEAQVQPLIKKAWRWYRAYLDWEDDK